MITTLCSIAAALRKGRQTTRPRHHSAQSCYTRAASSSSPRKTLSMSCECYGKLLRTNRAGWYGLLNRTADNSPKSQPVLLASLSRGAHAAPGPVFRITA